jgi:hypothetical protein
MSEKLSVVNQQVKKKGYFNFPELYEFCFLWFKEKGYKVMEKKYIEKESGGAKEVQLKWVCAKKITDYFMFEFSVSWHIIAMTDETVEIGGKAVKTNKGDLKMSIEAELVSDYEDRWETNPFNKLIRGIYDRYIIKTRADQQEDELEDRANKFIGDTKAFLELSGK